MTSIELLQSYLLNKDCFTFAVLQNCVLLYDKSNASKLHKRALSGDADAVQILQNMTHFDNARSTIIEKFLEQEGNECLETLCASELVEEYCLGDKYLLVCGKKRGNTKCFLIQREKKEIYNAFFYVNHFDKIIKEQYLGYLKRQDMKLAILTSLTYDMWNLFTEKVVLLIDRIHNNKCYEKK